MFAKVFSTVSLVLALSVHVNGHALIAPALGVQGAGARSDVQRVGNSGGCGNVDPTTTIDTSTPVAAAADGTFTVTATDFNAGQDGSRQVTGTVDATGAGKTFTGDVTITQNGDPNPSTVGSDQIVASLPAGTTCSGGAAGNLCLVSFVTTAGFGNCVVVSQGAGAATGAAATTGTAATNGTTTTGTAATNGTTTGTTGTTGTGTTTTTTNTGNGKGRGRGKNGGQRGQAAAAAAQAQGANANGQAANVANVQAANRAKAQAGSRAPRALIAELEARGEETLDVVKRGIMGWVWA